ncbi:DUF6243 family protein [Streptomyces sp. NPDC090127]|uniref:DUF6243 family protein n=1 Tax=Streptomyces sp. NPDC090127 TaxID=3365953 RepID=UPI00382C819A
MAKGRNNLLGVGGQRKKLSRGELPGAGQGHNPDRQAAADQKAELLKKMREKAEAAENATATSEATSAATAGDER